MRELFDAGGKLSQLVLLGLLGLGEGGGSLNYSNFLEE